MTEMIKVVLMNFKNKILLEYSHYNYKFIVSYVEKTIVLNNKR